MHRLKAIRREAARATPSTPMSDAMPQRRSPTCAREVAALHAELTRYGLVVWTAGNVSRPGARRTT